MTISKYKKKDTKNINALICIEDPELSDRKHIVGYDDCIIKWSIVSISSTNRARYRRQVKQANLISKIISK